MAEFRLLTWNVQNLFAAGTKDGPPTQAAFDAKLESLAEVLDTQQPDVAALQELGPPEVLAQLQDRLDHQLPHQQVSAHPDGRGIRVGFLSRLPLQTPGAAASLGRWAGAGAGRRRRPGPEHAAASDRDHGPGALQVTVTAHGHDLTILTAHLKSKPLTFPVAASRRATRPNGPASAPMLCTCGPSRPPPSALT